MKKRIVSLALSTAIVFSTFALSGCSDKTTTKTEDLSFNIPDTYPIQTDETLRYWCSAPATGENKGDLPLATWLKEQTGVSIKYEHPSSASFTEAFNLMIASDDMPDMMVAGWTNTNGGAANNIDSGVLTDLTPYIEGGCAPNFKKYLDEHPELKNLCTDTEGRYYGFPMILGGEVLQSYMCHFVRQDLLEKAGLGMPETIDEWETMLKAFKDMGIKTPLLLKISNYDLSYSSEFTACFDFIGTYYHDEDGKVKFGPYEKEKFSKWVETMARWYQEGLIDVDFVDTSTSRWDSIITNGENGAYYGAISTYAKYMDAFVDKSIKYIAVTNPTAVKGQKSMMNQKQSLVNTASAGISTSCDNVELAVRYLDYGYSEEGQLLYNFGREGISFQYVKDETGRDVPTYIVPEGKTLSDVFAQYTDVSMPISIQSPDYIYQNYAQPEQHKALQYASESDAEKYQFMTPIENMLSADEMKQVADKQAAIDTYREETINKIIAGKLPLSTLDEYYEQLKQMGIEDIIAVYQSAYDRFLQK